MGNILIVEDDPNIRKLVRVNLVKRGYTVSEAEDSHQAMARFSRQKRWTWSCSTWCSPGFLGWMYAPGCALAQMFRLLC
jgi:CheY-like chemotaxis protein